MSDSGASAGGRKSPGTDPPAALRVQAAANARKSNKARRESKWSALFLPVAIVVAHPLGGAIAGAAICVLGLGKGCIAHTQYCPTGGEIEVQKVIGSRESGSLSDTADAYGSNVLGGQADSISARSIEAPPWVSATATVTVEPSVYRGEDHQFHGSIQDVLRARIRFLPEAPPKSMAIVQITAADQAHAFRVSNDPAVQYVPWGRWVPLGVFSALGAGLGLVLVARIIWSRG
jgi:hypothetical protein